ncbi:MAG: aldehyde ferredoxin oxidoreductase family protein [Chloroflexi bacterium]|nr:aldehyde ferredoxin oxidoreductase family protein [Chloroflexota bacterium]
MTIGGTWGKLLHVDLSSGKTWVERPTDDLYLKLVGGRALVAYLLLRDMPAGADPLGPENLLIFAPGIFQGSNLPGAGRHGIGAKSPLTGALASSEAGGWWGHELKRTGYDALIVHGQAATPVYLWIRDGQAEIRPAAHLWGRDVADVETAIRAELDDAKIRVAQCGVAGENGVLFAAVINDANRAAGRNGLGAVMGSKNLKAVAVRGTRTLPVADRKRVQPVAKWLGENYRELSGWGVSMGTPGGLTYLNRIGGLPTRNFQDAAFPEAAAIGGATMHATILVGRDTCQACPIRCKQVVEYEGESANQRMSEWEEAGLRPSQYPMPNIERVYGGPEYETLGAFGSSCGVSDLVAVAKANELSGRWGLDTISTGMTIAFVMECVERGLLTAEQTGGALPKWGDAAAMLEAVDMIAHRRGFGDRMALGTRRLAQWIGHGAEAFTVEVKGQELPMHEPRLKAAMGVGYAVAPVGADHMMNVHDTSYTQPGDGLARVNAVYAVGPLPADDLGREKMELFYHEVNWQHFQDCAVTCMFYPYDYTHLAEALSGITGHDYGPRDILAVGERAQQLARLFNLREGLTQADDRLPRRVMQAFTEGPLAGIEITDAAFLAARQTWYGLMGWTPEGVPTAERLAALGLDTL